MCQKRYNIMQIKKLFSIIVKSYGCQFSQQQKNGMVHILDRVYSGEQGRHVLAVPCGIGKSTIIKIIIAHNIIEKIPTLIITDRLERLEEYISDVNVQHYMEKACGNNRYEFDVANLSNSADVQVDQTIGKMIVLLSLQKYNCLSDEQRTMLYSYISSQDRAINRTIIVDEALISHDIVKINNSVLGHMVGTLRDAVARLDGNYNELQDAINAFSGYTEYLQTEMQELEKQADNVTIPYISYRDSFTGMGKDSREEETFREVIQKSMGIIMGIDDEFKKNYEALINILGKGVTFFIAFGKNESHRRKEGNRYFLTKIDYKNNLPDKMPVWILDGTADIDIQYGNEMYILEHSKELHRSLKNVTIYFHKTATNSTKLKNKENRC